ncbi:MAG: hypothetical protein JWN04_1794, partial [Myxococcaceae bacterium]|nr:hypothetical protein [Myxococcaceae bacterium]
SWVEGLARRADLQSSVFWRCLNAGRIYLELTGQTELDPHAQVSAEALELADKIRRHAPKAVASEVLERTLEGELSRAELRRVWDTYRVAAGGATARGRLPEDPAEREQALTLRATAWEANKRKPETRADVRRGELVAAFRSGGWLGSVNQARSETKLPALSGQLAAVLVTRRNLNEPTKLELHGLWTAVSKPELTDFEYKAPGGLDFVWLAVSAELTQDALASAPRMLGLLELRRDRTLHVTREAQRRPLQAESRLSILSLLLQTAYLWPAP